LLQAFLTFDSVLVFFGQTGCSSYCFALIERDKANAHGIAANSRNAADVEADYLSGCGDDHYIIALVDERRAHYRAVSFARLDIDDALAAPALPAILADGRALAVTVFTDGQQGIGALRVFGV